MAETNLCPTTLIEDTPALDDAFRAETTIGPHERVANAIVALIASSETGGKMIGLEGGWGAGKSTVVNFVRKGLDASDNYTTILFDAWAHEGDPLRRTYLETLIHHLQDLGWVDVPEWDKSLDEIANRRKVTTTRTIPKPTVLGTLLAVTLFAVPFGSAFMGAALRDGLTIDSGQPVSWKFLVGLLSLGPLFALLGNALLLLLSKPFSIKHPFTFKRIPKLDSWAFLEGKAISETQTETVETPNPTSLEFEKHFGELMKESLKDKPNRRIVLVLDNLDRVDAKDALEIWSTLQTFLRDRFHHCDGWYSQLWVLVPYDPNGLRKLWDNRKENSTDEPEDARHASDSFIDKSFQIRFQVPPPVLSNWRTFLYGLVQQALPEHGADDQHAIYRVFDLCRGTTGRPPTPRELKLYVNQIGAIHRQWQHEFPMEHVAYYVLRCRDAQPLVQRLRDGKLTDDEASRWLGDSLKDSLAGLAFNVPAMLGQQLLLADPIYDALCQQHSDELKSLAESHGAGFWAVLEKVATSKFVDTEAAALAKAACCLRESKLLEQDETRNEVRTVRASLKSAAMSIDTWSPFDQEMADGIAALCVIASDESISSHMAKKVGSALATDAKEKSGESQSLVGCTHTVFEAIESLGHRDALATVTLPVDVDGWVSACEEIAKTWKQEFWKLVRPKVEFAEVTAKLTEAVNGDQFGQPHLHTINVTSAGPLAGKWKEVVAAMRQRLDAGQGIGHKPANWLLRGLNQLRNLGHVEASGALKALADDGHIMHHLHSAKGHPDNAVWCVFCFLRERPGAAKPGQTGNSDPGHDHLNEILASEDEDYGQRFLSLLENENEVSLLFQIVDARTKYDQMIRVCLRKVAGENNSERVLSVDLVLERWKPLQDALDSDATPDCFSKLVEHLSKSTNLCQTLIDRDGGFVADEIPLYSAVREEGNCESCGFGEWCKNGLEGIDQATWRSGLSGDFAAIHFLLDIRGRGIDVSLGHPFSEALEDHAKAVAHGKELTPEDLRPRWADTLASLSDSTRSVLRKRLLDVAIDTDGNASLAFFDTYGDDLADLTTISSNDRSISHFFSRLIHQRNVDGLQWLLGFLTANSDFIEQFSDSDSVKDFRERLQECLVEEVDDEAHKIISEIAVSLGVVIEQPADGGESDSEDQSDDEDSDPSEE